MQNLQLLIDTRQPSEGEFFYTRNALIIPVTEEGIEVLTEWAGKDRQITITEESGKEAVEKLQSAGFSRVAMVEVNAENTDILICISAEEAYLDIKFAEPHFIFVNSGNEYGYAGFPLETSCNLYNIHERLEILDKSLEYLVVSNNKSLSASVSSMLKTRGFNLVKMVDATPAEVLNYSN
jgi:hypothetical protein